MCFSRRSRAHLDGHLVVRAADAAGPHFEDRGNGLHCLLEDLDRRLAGLLPDQVQGAVDDLLRGRLLPAVHDLVDHLADELRAVDGIRLGLARLNFCAAWHG
jgi:hypothetical protein